MQRVHGRDPELLHDHGSDLAAIPVGTKVFYWGPVISDPNFLSSKVVARAGHGNRAFGYCRRSSKTRITGCAPSGRGPGRSQGFHASVDVTLDADGVFHWDGTYLFV